MLTKCGRNLLLAMAATAMTWLPGTGLAQQKTNVTALLRYAAEARIRAAHDKAEAIAKARLLGLPIRQELPGGKVRELMQFLGSVPVYYETLNLGAAQTVSADKVWPGGISGYNVTGEGVTIGEWDVGSALLTHQEFQGRATSPDGAGPAEHSTHVGGTLIAAGIDPNAHGMSFMGLLDTYDWNSDDSEMAAAAAAGLQLSNHSYGWFFFGGYEARCVGRDQIAYDAPYYLICQAAGNSGPSYGTLIVPAAGKNMMTVGAVLKHPAGYTGPGSVEIADFSSRGPLPDGRVKPDVVAPGVDLYSCLPYSNSAYGTMSGTSMASPDVCGNLGLMVHYFRMTHSGANMRAATLKALAIETADEAGPNPGPDFNYGWGQIDTYTACQVIHDSVAFPQVLQERVLTSGGTYSMFVNSSGTKPLKVTVCWTDPPGPPNGTDPTPVLVNDLDVRVIQNGTTYYPWKLDAANPDNAATTGDNIVDNVEQVEFQPQPGICQIVVSHKGAQLLPADSQAYSMVVMGASFANLTSFTVDPPMVATGRTTTGTVTIDVPAGSGGEVVKLTSSNNKAIKIPGSVTIPSGQTTASFSILGLPVSAPTPVTITAKYGTQSIAVDIMSNPPGLVSVTVNPGTVFGGASVTGTVTLGMPADVGGAQIRLGVDKTSLADLPWQVVIPEGSASANFTINTTPVGALTPVQVRAAYPGPTRYATLTLKASMGLSSVLASPSVIRGGQGFTGTVVLTMVAPANTTIQLTSDNTGVLTVPYSVTVPKGKKMATFKGSSFRVQSRTTVTVSGTLNGVTKTVLIRVNP